MSHYAEIAFASLAIFGAIVTICLAGLGFFFILKSWQFALELSLSEYKFKKLRKSTEPLVREKMTNEAIMREAAEQAKEKLK